MKHISLFTLLLLALSPPSTARAGFVIEEDDDRITLRQDDQVVLHYNKTPTAESKKHESFYSRSGYIHPLFSPAGKTVTGDFAQDHKHQHGLFFAWTKTKQDGKPLEFWNQKLKLGSIRFVKTLSTESDDESASFSVEHLFEDIADPEKPRPVLKEIWSITARKADGVFLFDMESNQKLIGPRPLTIEKYHYGGMAIRGPDPWFSANKEDTPPGSMLTSEGKSRLEGNHSRPDWVAMFGPASAEGGETAGVAVYCHPDNFRAPQWVRLHPSKPYFVYAPMVEEPFQIQPGETYTSKFRYVTFDGPPDVEKLNKLGFR